MTEHEQRMLDQKSGVELDRRDDRHRARSLVQEAREFEMTVAGYEDDPIDSDFQLGYAVRIVEELEARGYDTLARRLRKATEPYRQFWINQEDDPNGD